MDLVELSENHLPQDFNLISEVQKVSLTNYILTRATQTGYSGDLNIGLVRYSNGQKFSDC